MYTPRSMIWQWKNDNPYGNNEATFMIFCSYNYNFETANWDYND